MVLFDEFSALIQPFLRESMAVAVSGGADSLALALLLQEFKEKSTFPLKKYVALTVDHQLRENPAAEAQQVHTDLTARGVDHQTLTWVHPVLASRLEEKAREARYQLLTDFCKKNAIEYLLTAQHARDQIETFFMRRSRGSGLRGLSAMRPFTVSYGVTLGRPFLALSPERLTQTLQRFQQDFITDPSNFAPQFERTRWRKLLPQFLPLGLTEQSIVRSLQNLQDIDAQCTEAAQNFLRQSLFQKNNQFCFKKEEFCFLMPYVAQTVLLLLFQEITRDFRPISQSLLKRVYEKMIAPSFVGTTAAGCLIRSSSRYCFAIFQEKRK
ncbi:hypothetical protein AGMMS49949_04700 [Alphaproteobacteria bacterium]|nr:hypothetical protein AGMMS49949_04700 [Alphaproteobacteria bacterium]